LILWNNGAMTIDKQTSMAAKGAHAANGTSRDEAHPLPLGDVLENPLSEREMEVARLLVTGATNGEIARELVISPHTVKVHVRNVFDKLQVSSRTEASMLLVKRGWVTVPGVEVGAGETPAPEVEEATIPQVEPLPDREAEPRPWQLGIVMAALAVALVILLLPAWITTPKSTLGLLSDSGQTVLGQPVLNNLPYRWEIQPPLSQPRSRLAAVEVEGQIYAIGGEDEVGMPLDLVEIYDLASKQWRLGAPLPSPRANLALTISGDDLIVAGGSRLDPASSEVLAAGDDSLAGANIASLLYDDMARYNRAEDGWSEGGKLPMPLAGTALAAHGDMLYLLGGWNGQQMQDAVWQLPLAKFEDATAEDWEVVTHLPQAVAWFGAAMVDDLLYVVGGFDGRQELADCATYNVTTGEWRQLTSLNYPRGGVNLVYDGITVLALGGGWASTIQSHERYDALTNQWTTIASPISGEWRHFGAAANEGSVYILGGWSGAYLDMHVQFQSTFRALLPVIPNSREEE
jgi:DNA-binding CsgD family transcriptional regulator/N-acetylneuraminic acid mutarotase